MQNAPARAETRIRTVRKVSTHVPQMVWPIPLAMAEGGSEISIQAIHSNPEYAITNPIGRKPRGRGPTGEGPENVAISVPAAIKVTGTSMCKNTASRAVSGPSSPRVLVPKETIKAIDTTNVGIVNLFLKSFRSVNQNPRARLDKTSGSQKATRGSAVPNMIQRQWFRFINVDRLCDAVA